jgi:hypothetical protein
VQNVLDTPISRRLNFFLRYTTQGENEMLETRIEELTAAVRELIEVFTIVKSEAAKAPEVVKEPKETKKPSRNTGAEVKESSPPSVAATETEVPNEQQPTITDISPTSESESAPVTYDDVKKATNALSAAKGRDVTIDALSRFGVKRATELDEGQWADYIAYADKVIADE